MKKLTDIRKVRNKIFLRDGNRCCLCGSIELLCLDHLLPKPLYQIHDINNLMTLCLRCNFHKGVSILDENIIAERQQYIKEVNKIFTDDEVIEMNLILNEYFKPKKKRSKAKYKKRGYVIWDKKNHTRKVWEIFNEMNSHK